MRGVARVGGTRGGHESFGSAARHPQRPDRRRGRSACDHSGGDWRHDDGWPLKQLLFPAIAVIAAFVVGGLFVLAIGDSPIETYRLLIGSALWWPDGIGYTLFLS